MRTGRLAAALIAAASVFVLAGCVPFIPTGPMASDERDIEGVTTVVLDTSGDLSISEGAPGLVIHAPEDALDRLTSEVKDGALVLGVTPGPGLALAELRYELTVTDLETIQLNGSGDVDATVSAAGRVRLELDGSGNVEWTGLDAARVEIGLAGSGDIDLAGVTSELDIQLDGSGEVDADDLEAEGAVVSISGSGDVDVSVQTSLIVDISGSGRVTYSGDPSVQSDVSGSGDVVRE